MEMVMSYISQLVIVVGLLALAVSLFTEYGIKILWPKLDAGHINFVVMGVAILFTVLAFAIYESVNVLTIYWYYYVVVVCVGIFVGIVCMNGYDKVMSYIYAWLAKIFGKEE